MEGSLELVSVGIPEHRRIPRVMRPLKGREGGLGESEPEMMNL